MLAQMGLVFSVIPSEFDEDAAELSSPETYALDLARAKAAEVSSRHPDSWVIGADTIVVVDEVILGKPVSSDDARDMLRKLNGRTHRVLTGFSIRCQSRNREVSDVVDTLVTFKDLTENEIEWYIRTGEPFGKAGAYAIQGIGAFLVKRISGSYTNVVGLPICEVVGFLIREGIMDLQKCEEDILN